MTQRPTDEHRYIPEDSDFCAEGESRLKSSFWKHILVGYGIGMLIGAVLLIFILIAMQDMDLGIPVIFMIAALAQVGTAGGLVGAGIYISLHTKRDDDDDDDEPRGGKLERTTKPMSQTAGAPLPSIGTGLPASVS